MPIHDFNTFSYLSGVLTGMIIDWTDIVPLMTGLILGLSIKQMPEFVNVNDLPKYAQQYANKIKLFMSANSDV
jgi:hypothetical protein